MPNQSGFMSQVTESPDDYEVYFVYANDLADQMLGVGSDDDAKRMKFKEHVVKAMMDAEKSDWFFSPIGREKFKKVYGFEYPRITEYEQEMSRGKLNE